MTESPEHDAHPRGDAVLAYTDEDDSCPEVRAAATDHAVEHECTVILYPGDVASVYSEPLPNEWASDRESDLYSGDRLHAKDLVALGRAAIARQVMDGRRAGVETVAWLPKDKGLDAMMAYASDQGAHAVYLPAAMSETERLGSGASAAGEGRRPIEVITVSVDGQGERPA